MISFLLRPPCLSYVISLVAQWKFLPWVRVFYRCILMHSCVVKIIFPMLVFTRLCHLVSLVLMRLSSSIFTTGCHKHRFFICLLVSLWTHLLVVCGNDRPCIVCLILSRLCWCLMLILILVFSSSSPWLTHIILVKPVLKLSLLLVAQPCVCCMY